MRVILMSLAALSGGVFAAHLVVAATMAALTQGAVIAPIFQRMIDGLKAMNAKNPSFGPLQVRHPGNLVRDRTYIPAAQEVAAGAGASAILFGLSRAQFRRGTIYRAGHRRGCAFGRLNPCALCTGLF
jgi:hypothetical protein